jgi:hypothetical protein
MVAMAVWWLAVIPGRSSSWNMEREREIERAMRVGQSERGRKGGVAAVLTMSRRGGDAQVRGGDF